MKRTMSESVNAFIQVFFGSKLDVNNKKNLSDMETSVVGLNTEPLMVICDKPKNH